jgi:hypothetical protein
MATRPQSSPRSVSTVGNVLTLLAFALCTLTPVVALHETQTQSDGKSDFPEKPTDINTLASWPSRYEEWFSKNFAFRDKALELHAWATIHAFGVSPTPQVVLGREDWLFYTRDGIFPDRRGEARLGEPELVAWKTALETRRKWLQTKGIPYVFAVAPNKATIYSRFLPERHAQRPELPTRLEQLTAWLEGHSDFRMLDLRSTLERAAAQDVVYHVRDSHWNPLGAHSAYVAILGEIVRQGLVLEAMDRSLFTSKLEDYGGDLERLIPLPVKSMERAPKLRPTAGWKHSEIPLDFDWTKLPSDFGIWSSPVKCQSPGSPGTLLVISDSFSWAIRPFLAEHFGTSWFITSTALQPQTFEFFVATTKPTAVLELRVERNLRHTPAWHAENCFPN